MMPNALEVSGVPGVPGVPGWGNVGYKLGCPPAQDSSHHQDYNIFSRRSLQEQNVTVTGRGGNAKYES